MTWNSETDDGERNVGPFPEDILTEEEMGRVALSCRVINVLTMLFQYLRPPLARTCLSSLRSYVFSCLLGSSLLSCQSS